MLTISKPLSASQARTYHAREFASQQQNYWSRDQQGHSEWQGKLALQWKLSGSVEAEDFARLSEGQHPHAEQQLVRHQVSRTYDGKFGKEVTSAEHRAGWDATFSAPKSVSITALVGGDDRVRLAHRESVRVALAELELYTQARIGNVHAPETTGKFIAATFEHDTARPVDGYAAPQLHTHAVIFNVTERDNGQTRALQPHEIFVSQRYVTTVYRSELALRLQKLGYELERGKHGQPEIKGYTKEYLDASSPRREQIKEHLREQGIDGAAAAQIAAHHTRDRKELLSQEEVLRRHRELAAQFGHQADRVVAQAQQHGQHQMRKPEMQAQRAVTWARDHVFERSAVQDRRAILETALSRGIPHPAQAARLHVSTRGRIQFTAPANDLKVANRELGIIESIADDRRLRLKMDGGRTVELDLDRQVHLDYGYAATSHSSQGQTADRVLIHVDTELAAKDLLNSRMAYVAISRGAHDAQIFTNNASALGRTLSRDVSHAPAIQQESTSQRIEPQPVHVQEIAQGFGMGM